MVLRIWLIATIVLVALAWLLMVPMTPPPFQASPGTAVADYRAAGLVPKTGEMTISTRIGHDVFEIPETDAGMDDAGAADAGHGADSGVAGTMPAMPGMSDMPGMTATPAPAEDGHEATPDGLRVVDGMMAHMAKTTLTIDMAEWAFAPSGLTIPTGEPVRLVVRNGGNVPHEFMLMPPQGMNAVAYRLDRADWNLTEHESTFERQIVLPGDSFEVVVQTDQPGAWLYMCMFPYHMQFGMMGSLATEGAAPASGMDMGGMKM